MAHAANENGHKMGNYHGYYKIRPDATRRLALLDKEWFKDMSCIDIGCNDGQFCMSLAEELQPALLLGIDPDHVLIDSAKSRVKRAIHADKSDETPVKPAIVTAKNSTQPKACIAFRPRSVAMKTVAAEASKPAAPLNAMNDTARGKFPYNVKFKAMDIFDYSCAVSPSIEGKYDVVTCFSVTKWVHLNGGDAQLVDLFCRLFGLVRRGGRVIIEYQPWKSYENNKRVNDAARLYFPRIRCKPELFEWILTELVGFKIEARRGPSVEQSKGFDRPILVLRRPVELGSECRWGSEKDVPRLVELAYGHCESAVYTATTSVDPIGLQAELKSGSSAEQMQTQSSGRSASEPHRGDGRTWEETRGRHQKKRKCDVGETSEVRSRKHKI